MLWSRSVLAAAFAVSFGVCSFGLADDHALETEEVSVSPVMQAVFDAITTTPGQKPGDVAAATNVVVGGVATDIAFAGSNFLTATKPILKGGEFLKDLGVELAAKVKALEEERRLANKPTGTPDIGEQGRLARALGLAVVAESEDPATKPSAVGPSGKGEKQGPKPEEPGRESRRLSDQESAPPKPIAQSSSQPQANNPGLAPGAPPTPALAEPPNGQGRASPFEEKFKQIVQAVGRAVRQRGRTRGAVTSAIRSAEITGRGVDAHRAPTAAAGSSDPRPSRAASGQSRTGRNASAAVAPSAPKQTRPQTEAAGANQALQAGSNSGSNTVAAATNPASTVPGQAGGAATYLSLPSKLQVTALGAQALSLSEEPELDASGEEDGQAVLQATAPSTELEETVETEAPSPAYGPSISVSGVASDPAFWGLALVALLGWMATGSPKAPPTAERVSGASPAPKAKASGQSLWQDWPWEARPKVQRPFGLGVGDRDISKTPYQVALGAAWAATFGFAAYVLAVLRGRRAVVLVRKSSSEKTEPKY